MAARKPLALVVASTPTGGIGLDGALPWNLPTDMKHFKALTTAPPTAPATRHAVLMGRTTFFSIPARFRPLPGRLNVVLSRRVFAAPPPSDKENAPADNNNNSDSNTAAPSTKTPLGLTRDDYPSDVLLFPRLIDAVDALSKDPTVDRIFVIGGAALYDEAMRLPLCQTIYRTLVVSADGPDAPIPVDTYMPAIDSARFTLTDESKTTEWHVENGFKMQFQVYEKVPERHPEHQYLDLVRKIIEMGNDKGDRTGVGTLSLFGEQMRFDLKESFPLLTTKRVFWRGVAEELLWFVSGKTSAKLLQDKNIKIWDGNSSREYLDKIGLSDREEGDLGPVYGFQWRHYGATYTTMHDNYDGKGVDQLQQIIDTLRTNPNDRRMIMCAWNPKDMPLMALPPCHLMCQFYVANGELSCMMYQRSCDMGLGVPFNIASYALLTCMIAKVVGLVPGEFVHVLGDAHVYKNHVEPLREQLKNEPRPFPKLVIHGDQKNIDSFKFEDFELVGYSPHKTIAMKMAV